MSEKKSKSKPKDVNDHPDCQHLWVTNTGKGGKATFTTVNNKTVTPVKCGRCNTTANLTMRHWGSLPKERKSEKLVKNDKPKKAAD